MSEQRTTAAQRLAALREGFDTSFSLPPPPPPEMGEALLRLRVGGASMAVRLGQLSGLHLLPRVVRLPGAPASVLGVAGLRGQLVAVHDLASLLGLPASEEPPRWLLLAGRARRVGLAVAGFEGHLRTSRDCLRFGDGSSATHPLLNASVLLPEVPPLPVLDVDALVKELLEAVAAPHPGR